MLIYGLMDWLIPYLEAQLASKSEVTTLLQGALTKYGTRLEMLRQDPMNDVNHSSHSEDLLEILGYWTAYNRTVVAGNVTSQEFLAKLKPFIGKLTVIGALEAQSDKITAEGSKADEAFELIASTLRTWNASLLQAKANPKK